MRTNVATRRPVVAKKAGGIQYAALPYRVSNGSLQVLLVTSRRTRRWIVPKGWPVDGMAASTCAALEALEEAGVKREVQETPIGHYRYVKHHKNRASEPCKVEVYALKVTEQRKTWAEGEERKRRWYNPTEAASVVAEPLLQHLILEFEAQLLASAVH